MQTIVLNNCARHITCQLPHLRETVTTKDGKEISKIAAAGKIFILGPGLNIVESEELKLARKNPVFELNFTTKIARSKAVEVDIERIGRPFLELGKDVPDKLPFAKLPEGEVIPLIAEVENAKLLQRLLEGEGRTEIRAAIFDRMHYVTTGEEKKSA